MKIYLLKKEEGEEEFFFRLKNIFFFRAASIWRNLLSKQPVSRNANSASICKFESKTLILNRDVPQVLLHKLIEYLFIFNQNMFLGLG